MAQFFFVPTCLQKDVLLFLGWEEALYILSNNNCGAFVLSVLHSRALAFSSYLAFMRDAHL